MRSTPSFLGEFNQPKTKSSSSRPPAELKIEKEANLREKRKQILQRLKQKNANDQEIATVSPRQKPVQIDGISEKVIFSPRTAKRFQQASHRREITSRGDEIMRSNDEDMPTIVLQEVLENRCANDEKDLTKSEEVKNTAKEESESLQQSYIPSFTEKPPLRRLQESPSLSKRSSSPWLLEERNLNLEETQHNPEKDERSSNPQNSKTGSKDYLDKFDSRKPPLLSSNSLEVSDNDVESSPLRRSASFHSLKDRHKAKMTKRAEFLYVDDPKFSKTSSLPSVRLHSSSPASFSQDSSEASTNSRSLKLQQDKLEEDIHKLQEDLDRAFSELRKYLKTG